MFKIRKKPSPEQSGGGFLQCMDGNGREKGLAYLAGLRYSVDKTDIVRQMISVEQALKGCVQTGVERGEGSHMTKQEFLDTLRRALARELSESEVADNINYYWNYIEEQIASGKSEEEVLLELGDPRLIARTILEVDQKKEEEAEEGAARFFRESGYTDEEGYQSDESERGDFFGTDEFGRGSIQMHRMTVTDWIKVALVIIVILMILGGIFHILWRLLPVLLIVLAVMWIYRKLTGRD